MDDNFEFRPIYNCEYVNNNYIPNTCLISIILDYKDYFEGKWNNGNRLYKDQPTFTYEGIYKYLYPENIYLKDSPLGCSLEVSDKRFFTKYNIKLTVLNIYKKIIYENNVTTINKKVTPNHLYLLYAGNHVEKINDIKSLSQTIRYNSRKI